MKEATKALVQLQDIERYRVPRFDFHLHTSWTDGRHTADEMYKRAKRENLTHVLFSEHGRKTSGDWFGEFAAQIRNLPHDGCRAFVGLETKISDFEGSLDCTPEMVSLCDLVIASVHRFPGEEGIVRGFDEVTRQEAVETEYRLASAILENPDVDILAHPFGMCYRRFHVYPSDEQMKKLIKKASKTCVALEINAYYHPRPWQMIEWCKEFGTRFSLGSNAHAIEDVGRIIRILEGKEKSWTPSAS